jgi:hypothetical protein
MLAVLLVALMVLLLIVPSTTTSSTGRIGLMSASLLYTRTTLDEFFFSNYQSILAFLTITSLSATSTVAVLTVQLIYENGTIQALLLGPNVEVDDCVKAGRFVM